MIQSSTRKVSPQISLVSVMDLQAAQMWAYAASEMPRPTPEPCHVGMPAASAMLASLYVLTSGPPIFSQSHASCLTASKTSVATLRWSAIGMESFCRASTYQSRFL